MGIPPVGAAGNDQNVHVLQEAKQAESPSQHGDPYHNFVIATKKQQEIAIQSAIENARELAEEKPQIRHPHMQARRLAKKALETFEKELKTKFPDKTNLITLVIEGRETAFLIDLKDRITELLESQSPDKGTSFSSPRI